MRYKLQNGNHDRLTICSLGWRLLVLLPLAAGVVLGAISAKQTAGHTEIELLTIANLCVNVALIARGVLDRGEEADRIRDLDSHRFQHGDGVRPARFAAHALIPISPINEVV